MPKVTKRQLLRSVAQLQKMLEGFTEHGDLLPDPLIVDGKPVSQREIREQLATAIKGLLEVQQGIDDAQAKLDRAVVVRSEGVRKFRADHGEEILAKLGLGDPEGEAERHTRAVRRRRRR